MSFGWIDRNDAGCTRPRLGAGLRTSSWTAAAAGILALVAGAGDAHAAGPVTGTGKGIVGGALLGGEAVALTMGAIGVESGWPYFVFGGVGAAGGGIGGYFIEKNASPEAAVYLLAGGMALAIPTIVVALNATSYRPPADDRAEPVTNQPANEPPAPGAPRAGVSVRTSAAPVAAPRPLSRVVAEARVPRIPLSLVDLREGTLALGVPAPAFMPMYTMRELATYGVEQRTEVRLPVFEAKF